MPADPPNSITHLICALSSSCIPISRRIVWAGIARYHNPHGAVWKIASISEPFNRITMTDYDTKSRPSRYALRIVGFNDTNERLDARKNLQFIVVVAKFITASAFRGQLPKDINAALMAK